MLSKDQWKIVGLMAVVGFILGWCAPVPAQAMSHGKQIKCMADNIYWEARNQSLRGMIAVGNVTMNRVYDERFPDTPCEVVHQGPTRPSWKDPAVYYPVRNRCQFSWYCDGKSDVIPEYDRDVYELIYTMSMKLYYNYFDDFTSGATHYHADYVRPAWACTKEKTIQIGKHIFYRWRNVRTPNDNC